jgi:hypothetical protein
MSNIAMRVELKSGEGFSFNLNLNETHVSSTAIIESQILYQTQMIKLDGGIIHHNQETKKITWIPLHSIHTTQFLVEDN